MLKELVQRIRRYLSEPLEIKLLSRLLTVHEEVPATVITVQRASSPRRKHMNFKALLSTALLAVAGTVFGQGSQPQISPQSIIVNPVQNDLQVSVRVDRAGENPSYNIGERIRITASVNQDAYVYLFSVHSDGSIDLILPNQLSSGNVFLRAGETRSFPPANGGYLLQVDGPVGQDKVLAVASKRQLNIDELASFKGNQPFATITVTGQDNLARALSIIVQPIPASDWVTNVAYFQVQPRGGVVNPPAATTGNVQVTTRQGATVYLDGTAVGNAPINFTASPGRHEIRVKLDGYKDFTATINVIAGRTLNVNAPLVQIAREGTLSIRANVAGALVFINGQQVGRIGTNGTFSIAGLPVGNHEVVVIARGYRAFVSDFSIDPGQVTPLNANLTRI
jgi:hypothetical protein